MGFGKHVAETLPIALLIKLLFVISEMYYYILTIITRWDPT